MRIECAYNEILPIESLVPHPQNRNRHSEKQIKALAKIIAKNGQRSPIVVSKRSGYIVKGHGRYEAIKLLGWGKCAVDEQDYSSDLEEFNDRIADNEIAKYSEFDRIGFDLDVAEFGLDQSQDWEEFGLLDYMEIDKVPDDVKETKDVDLSFEYKLEVDCGNEEQQQYLFGELNDRGFKVRILL